MDLGAAAEGIAAAHYGMLLICTLAIHLLAVSIASIAIFQEHRRGATLASIAVAIIITNHLALLVMGDWRVVVLGSIFWTHFLMAATGWILLVTYRVEASRRSISRPLQYSAAAALVLVGLCIAFVGLRAQFHSRTNVEDDISLATGSVGLASIAAGVALPFARGPVVLAVALCTPYAAFVLVVALFWGTAILRAIFDL